MDLGAVLWVAPLQCHLWFCLQEEGWICVIACTPVLSLTLPFTYLDTPWTLPCLDPVEAVPLPACPCLILWDCVPYVVGLPLPVLGLPSVPGLYLLLEQPLFLLFPDNLFVMSCLQSLVKLFKNIVKVLSSSKSSYCTFYTKDLV